MDVSSKQLIGEVHTPIPCKPGTPMRIDHEDVKNGVCDIFMEAEPLNGRRQFTATQRHTQEETRQIKHMLDDRYPEAINVRLLMDNWNTHSIASLYETFEPQEAGHPAEQLDMHYAPKHRSWFNISLKKLVTSHSFERSIAGEREWFKQRRSGSGIKITGNRGGNKIKGFGIFFLPVFRGGE